MRIKIVSALLLTLAACGGQGGSDYAGAWTRHTESSREGMMGSTTSEAITDTLTITRNGSGFLMAHQRTLVQDGGKPFVYPSSKEAAVLKDNQLQVSGGLGSYVIDQKNGHLVPPDGQGDYTRAGK